MTHLDLFSGIGGFALAARWAGLETIGFCEIDEYAQRVLSKNFGAHLVADADGNGPQTRTVKERATAPIRRKLEGSCPLFPDIRKLDGRQFQGVDLVTGGFPCQPFSLAGKRRGARDDRALWPDMLRIIRQAGPRWVLGENVPGIIDLELARVLASLEDIGYAARPLVIPACAVDAKHRRNRVWILAHRESRRRPELRGTSRGAGQFNGSGEVVADALPDALRERCDGRTSLQEAAGKTGGFSAEGNVSKWPVEPGMGRVAHGVPHRVDRLRCLGNAIVPKVAYQLIKMIVCHDHQKNLS